MMASVTGGTPTLLGVYHDVAYDRVLAPPSIDTRNGVLHGNCAAVYPWTFIRANTVYGVVRQTRRLCGRVRSHGTYTPTNLDDYYAPEINSNIAPLPGVKTATGIDCSTIPHPIGGDSTGDFDNIKCYDQLKSMRSSTGSAARITWGLTAHRLPCSRE